MNITTIAIDDLPVRQFVADETTLAPRSQDLDWTTPGRRPADLGLADAS